MIHRVAAAYATKDLVFFRLALGRNNDSDRLTDGFCGRVAEHPFRRPIP
jgi:hypothetical protein